MVQGERLKPRCIYYVDRSTVGFAKFCGRSSYLIIISSGFIIRDRGQNVFINNITSITLTNRFLAVVTVTLLAVDTLGCFLKKHCGCPHVSC